MGRRLNVYDLSSLFVTCHSTFGMNFYKDAPKELVELVCLFGAWDAAANRLSALIQDTVAFSGNYRVMCEGDDCQDVWEKVEPVFNQVTRHWDACQREKLAEQVEEDIGWAVNCHVFHTEQGEWFTHL